MSSDTPHTPSRSEIYKAVTVAALGYFVDLYDLILFSIVRVKSLVGLGVPRADLLDQGVFLLNMQMAGMLIGGVLWGILGDKRGRLSVLYGSILLYSLANLGNGLVQSVEAYAVMRLLAGIGLAGELGAGVTLVSEIMDRHSRGWGATVISTVGVMGAVTAALVGDKLDWRTSYFVGGGLGLALFLLRVRVRESAMFERLKTTSVARGSLWTLLRNGRRAWRYASVILIGLPIWYTAAILITFCPEFGRVMGMTDLPSPAKAVMYYYIGLTVGDFASGWLSQLLRTRKRVVAGFILATLGSVALYFLIGGRSLTVFYSVCGLMGAACGYWAVFVTIASEQFGTNVRSTVTTTVPNFVRGAVVPITLTFKALKGPLGVQGSAIAVGAAVFLLTFVALYGLEETYGRDLDYVEE